MPVAAATELYRRRDWRAVFPTRSGRAVDGGALEQDTHAGRLVSIQRAGPVGVEATVHLLRRATIGTPWFTGAHLAQAGR